MKNQLIQAIAAIKYADQLGKKLRFHMNGVRTEQNGGNNLKNIKGLFSNTSHELVLHPWLGHEEFLELLANMDICLQVSLTESFNITAADAVSIGVPLVGSSAIRWLPRFSQALPDSVEDICRVLSKAGETMIVLNHSALSLEMKQSEKVWFDWAKSSIVG